MPTWPASEFQAIARGSCSRGTSIGPSAVLAGAKKAREAPNRTAATSRTGAFAILSWLATARPATTTISAT